ncbi:MAG: MFS transporter [Actinomyces sp.]|jgi:polyol permease family|nr:MFS transporter [Actinomyces sp.]MCI1788363.1 MFS transporter [Actinomyces sp.]MCI1831182.1 MFS transporter [Actinomyces sp.]
MSANVSSPPVEEPPSLLQRQGIEPVLKWGFLAVALFMVGDGLEQGFLSPYLTSTGFTVGQVATLFSVYGAVVAVSSWLAGALSDAWGCKRVMMIGFIIWVAFHVVFLGLGVGAHSYPWMLLSYGIRGIGYPFFAYGFLVWVTLQTPRRSMGKAVGWFWFCDTVGFGVISGYLAGFGIPVVGMLGTLWLSLVFVGAGGIIAFALLHEAKTGTRVSVGSAVSSALESFKLMAERPKVGIGGLVRVINTTSLYAFGVYMTVHMTQNVGFSATKWQSIWATMLFANVLGNLFFGYLGDKLGRVNVVAWIGGLGCFVTVAAMYYVPQWVGANYPLVLLVSILYGLCLSAYVPLSAIMPALAPERKALAVSVLNLGAGLSNFIGPAIVSLFIAPLGMVGVNWIIAGLYIVSLLLTLVLRSPAVEVRDTGEEAEAA